MTRHRNNRLMIVLFGMASLCFLFHFIGTETNGIETNVTGIGLAKDGLKNLLVSDEDQSSGEWMVLAAFALALIACGLNFFLHNPSELINSLLAAVAYLNLFSFRTQRMHGFSAMGNLDELNMHFGWAYWLALVLLLIIVIQQVNRFIRWQHSSAVKIGDGVPSSTEKSN